MSNKKSWEPTLHYAMLGKWKIQRQGRQPEHPEQSELAILGCS